MQTVFASFLYFYLSFVKIIFIKFITDVIITVFIQYLSQIKKPLHFLQSMKFGGENLDTEPDVKHLPHCLYLLQRTVSRFTK